MIRTNCFVKYLLYDNNGRLDGFMDHNMKPVNQSVSGYTKYTNLMTSYGIISHILH